MDKEAIRNKVATLLEDDSEGAVGKKYNADYHVNLKTTLWELLEEDIPLLLAENDQQAKEIESLKSKLDAKLTFIANGMEEEHWALQEQVIELEKYEWLWKTLKQHKQGLVNKFNAMEIFTPEQEKAGVRHKTVLDLMEFLEIKEQERVKCKTCHDIGEVTQTVMRRPDEYENMACPDCQGEDKP